MRFLQRNQRKEKKSLKKGLKRIKSLVLFILFAATVTSLALSSLFNIKGIKVKGSSRYKPEDIVAATDLTIGNNGFRTIGRNSLKSIGNSMKNILTLRYGKAEQDIQKKFPYIKEAKVQFILTGKMRILLTERIPYCLVPYNGTNLVVDEEGVVVDTTTENIKLPVFKGLKFPNYELGQKLQLDNPECFKLAGKLLVAIQSADLDGRLNMSELVTFVEAEDAKKISVKIDSRILVNFGDLKDINYRISFFKQIYKSLKKEDKGVIDFTTGENPSFRPER